MCRPNTLRMRERKQAVREKRRRGEYHRKRSKKVEERRLIGEHKRSALLEMMDAAVANGESADQIHQRLVELGLTEEQVLQVIDLYDLRERKKQELVTKGSKLNETAQARQQLAGATYTCCSLAAIFIGVWAYTAAVIGYSSSSFVIPVALAYGMVYREVGRNVSTWPRHFAGALAVITGLCAIFGAAVTWIAREFGLSIFDVFPAFFDGEAGGDMWKAYGELLGVEFPFYAAGAYYLAHRLSLRTIKVK